jgi:uncharacterized protein (DUF433 family)
MLEFQQSTYDEVFAMGIVPRETTLHRYITTDPAVCDGKPIIAGTRTRVVQIAVEYDRLGWTPDEIVEAHPHLTLAEVHDALSYYYEHRMALDGDIMAGQADMTYLGEQYPSKLVEP